MAAYREIEQEVEQSVIDYLTATITGITGLVFRGWLVDDDAEEDEEDKAQKTVSVVCSARESVGDATDFLFEMNLLVQPSTHFLADAKNQLLSELMARVATCMDNATAIDALAPNWIRILGFQPKESPPKVDGQVSSFALNMRAFVAATTAES